MTSIADETTPDAPASGNTWSIAEAAAATGLTKDTLRWYEREGLIPHIGRTTSGYRSYDEQAVRMLHLIVRLRRTGMPVTQIREFVLLVEEGAASHGRRTTLLHEHRQRVLARLVEIRDDLSAIDDKIAHYDRLIDAGLDCGDRPITDDAVRTAQKETS